MWLVLCTSDDRPALWAVHRLRARGLDPLVVLTPDLLQYSSAWEHRISFDGRTSIEFTLADGRRIDGGSIRGVLNRIAFLPAHLASHLTPDDRLYALQEWTALHISWLSSLDAPVLNLPVMQGLCGAWRHRSEWIWLASRAGLETPSYPQEAQPASVRTVFVVDGEVVNDDLPREVAAACARLGILARTRLLGIDLEAETGRFLDASPRPDLRLGGEPLADVLALSLDGA